MIAWAIVGGIVGVILLILLCPIQALLFYDGDFALKVGVPFFKLRIFPNDEARLASEALSPRQKRRILKKIAKKKARDEKKSDKKQQKKAKKGKADASKKTPSEKDGAGQAKKGKGILRDIRFIARVVKILIAKFGRRLHIKIKRFDVVVATGDAASTAYLFGAVSQSVAYLFAAADGFSNLRYSNRRVNVHADFLGEKTRVEGKILFSIRVGSVLHLLLSAVWLFVKQAFTKKTAPSSSVQKGEKGTLNQEINTEQSKKGTTI